MKKLNAVTLKEELWGTLLDIRENKLEASKGDAIASQAREILRTLNTQLRIVDKAKKDVSNEMIQFALVKQE